MEGRVLPKRAKELFILRNSRSWPTRQGVILKTHNTFSLQCTQFKGWSLWLLNKQKQVAGTLGPLRHKVMFWASISSLGWESAATGGHASKGWGSSYEQTERLDMCEGATWQPPLGPVESSISPRTTTALEVV